MGMGETSSSGFLFSAPLSLLYGQPQPREQVKWFLFNHEDRCWFRSEDIGQRVDDWEQTLNMVPWGTDDTGKQMYGMRVAIHSLPPQPGLGYAGLLIVSQSSYVDYELDQVFRPNEAFIYKEWRQGNTHWFGGHRGWVVYQASFATW